MTSYRVVPYDSSTRIRGKRIPIVCETRLTKKSDSTSKRFEVRTSLSTYDSCHVQLSIVSESESNEVLQIMNVLSRSL